MTCGVYQILNTLSGESYVGYARDIEERWQQHVALRSQVFHRFWPSYPLSEALSSQPLDPGTLKQGRNGGFEFFVVEQCDRKDLIQRYQVWLTQLQPHYNLPFPRAGLPVHRSPQAWVYVHNWNRLQNLPNESLLDQLKPLPSLRSVVFDALHVRRNAIYPGDAVYSIVGFGGKQKYGVLWNVLAVEEVNRCLPPDDKLTLLLGQSQRFLTPRLLEPQQWNDLKATCGHFRNACMLVTEPRHRSYLQELQDSMRQAQRLEAITTYFEQFYQQAWQILEQRDRQLGCHLALLYYQQGQDLRALEILGAILQRHPDCPQARYYRALVHLQLAHPRLARQDLEEALALLQSQPDSELLAQVQALWTDFNHDGSDD